MKKEKIKTETGTFGNLNYHTAYVKKLLGLENWIYAQNPDGVFVDCTAYLNKLFPLAKKMGLEKYQFYDDLCNAAYEIRNRKANCDFPTKKERVELKKLFCVNKTKTRGKNERKKYGLGHVTAKHSQGLD
jgi:hypothetical protein